MPGIFSIEHRLDYYCYTFTSEDQCILFFSRLYSSVAACKSAIDKLPLSCTDGRYIEKHESKGEYSFVVKDKKGEVLGHSIVYFAASSRDYAIRKLSREISSAKIIECAEFINNNGVVA